MSAQEVRADQTWRRKSDERLLTIRGLEGAPGAQRVLVALQLPHGIDKRTLTIKGIRHHYELVEEPAGA